MATTTTKKKSLAAKLVAIRDALEPLTQKKGQVGGGNGRGPSYNFHKAEDVQAHVRGALVEQGVLIIPKVVDYDHQPFVTGGGSAQFLTTVKMVFEVIDADSDETLEIPAVGSGTDSGEKGLYKAQTGAWKYMLLGLFELAAGDDFETSSAATGNTRATTQKKKASTAAEPELATAQAVQNLKATAHMAGFDADQWQNLLTAVGVVDETQFPATALADAKREVFEAGAKAAA